MFSTPKLEDVKIYTLVCNRDVNKLKTDLKVKALIKATLPGEPHSDSEFIHHIHVVYLLTH